MIFLLDNYDSFTYNLYDYLKQTGSEVRVERNDKITVRQIAELNPSAIVLSPGPKTPNNAGILLETVSTFHQHIPLLGICLGYQAIGMFYGAELIHSPKPVHGKTSSIFFDDKDQLFQNIPQGTEVMRYHSLNIQKIPSELSVIAQTIQNEPMAIRHNTFPVCGFQFHPESVLTPFGMQMIKNWYSEFIKPPKICNV